MTTLTTTFRGGHSPLRTFFRTLSDLFDGIREGREMELRYNELSRLSDAELARQGIKREEIPNAVLAGRGVIY